MTEETVVEREYPNRVPATALFNRLNGELVSVVSVAIEEAQYNESYYIARSVMYDFGANGDKIEGKINISANGVVTDDFKVLAADEQTITIYESQMNALAAEKITSKFPLTKQINLLANAVNKLAAEHDLLKSPEFEALNEMVEFINYCVQVNQTKKEHYANDPTVNYISDKAAADALSRRMEGGVHEEIGAKTITGGRVWS
ncbi:hypothetical protein ST201phi2-1p221 [Pseudomonas phage 201phi2-1]|uniref:Uncharacterized protein n=1 Tax=Pseudomonas phage 201phi2-1 TaxID=198110 RepID=B3FJ83_BP201|nr:hypothetical protein ST201phi2-1p221 [Pseudomonas phage 201phi2-1]ABY63050.1 hypothetical protein 201phi2-1p221 [Pseudomonas phage 201phi2-1]